LIRKVLRGAIHILGGLGAGLAIMMVLAAWRLSSGPISLAFMSPYIENTLNSFHDSFRLRLDDTILTWAGWERTLDIRVLNVRAYGEGDALIASVPELSLSLSASALVKGVVAPKSVELFRPKLKLVRHRDGSFEVGFNSESTESDQFFGQMLTQLLSSPQSSQAMSYLSNINIFDADLTVVDQSLRTSWNAPHAQAQLRRDGTGIKGDLTMDVVVGDKQANISVIGGYLADERRIDLGVDFSKVTPAVFAALSPELSPLASFELPMQGTLTFSMTIDGAVESLGFDVAGGKGHLAVPVEMAQKLGVLSLAQRIEVDALSFRGRYEGTPEKIEINDLTLDLGAEGKVYLPDPFNHEMPLRSINARGRYLSDSRRLELETVTFDLHGPKASIAVNLMADDGGLSLGASGVVKNMPINRVAAYWPRGLAGDARKWVTGNISEGMAPEARIATQMHFGNDGKFSLLTLSGDMDIRGATVDYLSPMPKAINTNATVRFNKKKFDIFITHSEAAGLSAEKGIVSLTGLDEFDQYADIDLFIKGPMKSAMRMIEHQPLGFSSAIGIDPERTDGNVNTHLKLGFLIENTLTMSGVDVVATAKMMDVSIANVILGQAIEQGQLDLVIDKQGMDIKGDVKLGRIPASLKWRRNFAADAPFRGRFDIASDIDNIRNLGDIGIDLSPLHGDFVEGGVGANIRLTLFDESKGQVQIKLDMEKVFLNVPAMGWSKQAGVAGIAQVNIDLDGELITDIPLFSIAAGDLRISGSAKYAKDGTGLEKVNVNQVSYNRTDLAGIVIPGHDGGWTVSFHGPSFDLEPMFDDLFKSTPDEEDKLGLNLSMSVKVDKIWLGPNRYLKQVTGTFTRGNERWRGIAVDGVVGEGKRFEVKLEPTGLGKRSLRIRAADAGDTLRSLGFYDNLVGGFLDIEGVFDDTQPGHPLTGRLLISDYRIVNAPALVQLVSFLSLSGIVESLQGDGLAFSDFDVPFVLKKGVIEIEDAKATGISLGYTAKGRIYTHAEVVDIEGTMVPAYALNSVLGNIPIIGTLLTGTEEGGGIFAVSYAMNGPVEKMKVSVNPMTALAPGIFRNLFGILADSPPSAQFANEPEKAAPPVSNNKLNDVEKTGQF